MCIDLLRKMSNKFLKQMNKKRTSHNNNNNYTTMTMAKWPNASNSLDIIFVIQHLKMNKSSIVWTMTSTMQRTLAPLHSRFAPLSLQLTQTHTIIAGELDFYSLAFFCFKKLMTDQKDEKSILRDNRLKDLATYTCNMRTCIIYTYMMEWKKSHHSNSSVHSTKDITDITTLGTRTFVEGKNVKFLNKFVILSIVSLEIHFSLPLSLSARMSDFDGCARPFDCIFF